MALKKKTALMVASPHVKVRECLQNKKILWASDDRWRLFVCVVHALVFEPNIVFPSIQGLSILVSEQHENLKALEMSYCIMTQMEIPSGEKTVLQQLIQPSILSKATTSNLNLTRGIAYME